MRALVTRIVLAPIAIGMLASACADEPFRPVIRDPEDVVASFEVGRLVEEFGFSLTSASVDLLPYVFESSPGSRIVLVAAFSAVGCEQAPIISVHEAGGAIDVEITPRRAEPEADCDAMSVAWIVELRLTEALGDRTVGVTLATTGPTGP